MKAVLMAAVVCVLAGCAATPYKSPTQVTLTVTSMPSGAVVRAGGSGEGAMTTFVSVWEKSELEKYMEPNGCYRVHGFTATWPSGAEASTEKIIKLCGANNQYGIVINRPRTKDGGAVDYEFSLKAEAAQRQARQSQPSAAQTPQEPESSGISFGQALGAILGGMAEGYANRPAPSTYEPRRPINCVTRNIAGNIQTTCE